MKYHKLILGSFVLIYLILGILDLTSKRLTSVDNFIAAVFCLVFFLLTYRYKVSTFTAIIAGLIFAPHILGNYGLYELASLNYHYDWIVHATTPIFSTLAIMNFSLQNKLLKKIASAAFIAISITIAFGALIETSEYWGFRIIGFGEGYLGFGAGDDSKNYGPWENSSLDTSLNILGSVMGVLLYTSQLMFKKRK